MCYRLHQYCVASVLFLRISCDILLASNRRSLSLIFISKKKVKRCWVWRVQCFGTSDIMFLTEIPGALSKFTNQSLFFHGSHCVYWESLHSHWYTSVQMKPNLSINRSSREQNALKYALPMLAMYFCPYFSN